MLTIITKITPTELEIAKRVSDIKKGKYTIDDACSTSINLYYVPMNEYSKYFE